MKIQKMTQRDWKIETGANVSIDDFNNVTDVEHFGIFPGQRGDGANVMLVNADSQVDTVKYNPYDYAFSIYKSGYFYGMKKDNTEVLGIYDNGIVTPVTAGAGGFAFGTIKREVLYAKKGVKSFEVHKVDEYDAITVTYYNEGNNDCVPVDETTYVFKERCISATARIKCLGMGDGYRDPSFKRVHINNPEVVKNKVAYVTVHPENGEHAYNDVESYVVAEKYGDKAFYCFSKHLAGEKIKAAGYGVDALPVRLERDLKDVEFDYEIDFAVADADASEGYIALFKGRNMDFAAGVASVDKNDNTTFFRGHNALINLNVTNLVDEDIKYSVQYNVMNYYNEEVDSHTFLNNTLEKGTVANHNISLNLEKYGMYYLNLYVASENFEYREIYSFAMIEEFDYKHREENPFGLCETHHESDEHAKSIINALNGIGVSLVRASASSTNEFLDQMYNAGLTRFAMGNASNFKAEGVENYKKAIRDHLNRYGDRIDYYLTCNETDSPTKANYDKATKYLNETFIPYAYNPAYEVISKEFPEILNKTIWQSNCHGTTEWLEAFHECGMWDNSEFIDIHTYSSPSGPDKVFSNQPESMYANTYSNEYAAVRWKRAKRRYGEKRMIVGETGYPAPPPCGDLREIDFRTQADFNTRIVLFLLEAGAEDIIFYSLLDRPSFFVGTGTWNEMYFGAFHNYDYYGVYMPKPWAAAYANITRRFDGYTECAKNTKYDEDEFGTLRAFDVKTKENGDFTVLWSNVYMQPNTTAAGRVNNVERLHMELWESRWLESETREFDTDCDIVKVVDLMGNVKEYKAVDGKVKLEITGSPIYVYGI